jgi:hypothetical protein
MSTAINSNNLLGDLPFGPLNDPNIVSTFMGIAVLYNGTRRIYDIDKATLTDLGGDVQIGDLPIFICPSTEVAVGDLLKEGIDYLYVKEVADDGSLKTLNAKTGEMKEIVPIKNLLGFKIYTKVLAFDNVNGDNEMEKIMLLSAFGNVPANVTANDPASANNNLMMMMLLNDGKLGIANGGDSDMKKIMTYLMLSGGNGGNMNPAMLMLFPEMFGNMNLGEGGDMKKMLMVLMLSGGGNNNMLPLMMLMGNKKAATTVE